ncbi:MAG: hypothetical protein IJZ36_00630 [Bacilli bacterium]|nr:hypothetical protein [Bacilli bacterium]
MNNKGFAVSGVIYSILILFLIIITLFLGIVSNRRTVLNKISRKAQTEVYERLNSKNE